MFLNFAKSNDILWMCDDVVLTVNDDVHLIDSQEVYYNNRINFGKLDQYLSSANGGEEGLQRVSINIQY